MTSKYVIDYLEFPSTDGAQSRQFFANAFGWTFTDFGPSYTGINDAGIESGIDADTQRAAAPLAIIRTSDLEQALLQVVGAGGTITRDPFDFPGGRRFHFREPGGNELAVWIAVE